MYIQKIGVFKFEKNPAEGVNDIAKNYVYIKTFVTTAFRRKIDQNLVDVPAVKNK